MSNCQCGNLLREGERECDMCLLRKYDLITGGKYMPTRERFSTNSVAQALRRAEKGAGDED